jgi:hypothetical protein
MNDWRDFLLLIFGFAGSVVGWFTKTLWDAVQKLRKDLDDLRVHIAEAYVTKIDLTILKQEIHDRFDRLERLITGKQDK